MSLREGFEGLGKSLDTIAGKMADESRACVTVFRTAYQQRRADCVKACGDAERARETSRAASESAYVGGGALDCL